MPDGLRNEGGKVLMHLRFFNSFQDDVGNPNRVAAAAVAAAIWELGTAAEALTELNWPSLSVFNASAFPPPHILDNANNASDVLNIANNIVSAKPSDSLALVANDGAVGDPASIGVAVLLANWTSSNVSFATAASDQLDYLLNVAPRADSGAISQRTDQVQLWADFIYMAPPFIAYYGALVGGDNESYLLQTAYEQISLYRDVLRDDDGLWRHVDLGSWQDNTHWATGNGWAAAGMLRVLETFNHSSVATDFTGESANLTLWIQEIINAAWQHQTVNGTLLNIIDDPTSFADSSGTALLASVTYRMAVYLNDTSLIPYADKAFQLVQSSIDEHGWLRNTADPEAFSIPSAANSSSPEGQAFILLAQSAYEQFVSSNLVSNPSYGSAGPDNGGDDGDDGDEGRSQRCRLVPRPSSMALSQERMYGLAHLLRGR
ncbi:Six-hairpin glycosidase-like protein [Rhodocollybia butyracea]|uniref:Six-hairpin glycosidase-like protein n=1 Tax=Rhodocollybia butyracea TaxID=206335 RepID=A0A9P5Q888_9AGAR|nr:Six-hairpin glycosidase-like protein [Rhodocollybia butyracea]